MPGFCYFHGVLGGWNSHPQACVATTSPAEPSSQLKSAVFSWEKAINPLVTPNSIPALTVSFGHNALSTHSGKHNCVTSKPVTSCLWASGGSCISLAIVPPWPNTRITTLCAFLRELCYSLCFDVLHRQSSKLSCQKEHRNPIVRLYHKLSLSSPTTYTTWLLPHQSTSSLHGLFIDKDEFYKYCGLCELLTFPYQCALGDELAHTPISWPAPTRSLS